MKKCGLIFCLFCILFSAKAFSSEGFFDLSQNDSSEKLRESSDEVFDIDKINLVISQTFDFKDGKYSYKDITRDQFDVFIDAMGSLDYWAMMQGDHVALKLFNEICDKYPFNHPQLLGDW